MSRLTIAFILLTIPALILSKTCNSDPNQGWASSNKLIYTSASAIEGVLPSQVCPSINPAKVPGMSASLYLVATGPLGYLGPLGPQGPLGILGPVGSNSWSPSSWMFSAGDWKDWSKEMTGMGGPLSKDGPLGPNGPVSPAQYYGQQNPGLSLFSSNDFAVQLRAFGLWSALGPIGPLGALGPLGPLGPIGAHGYKADKKGSYAARTISVSYPDGDHTFELFENYDEDFASKMSDQDTSFMVEGTSATLGEIDYFPINSNSDQIITIVLVPVYDLTSYSLAVYDSKGKLVGSSETTGYVQTMQLTVPSGTSLTVAVKLAMTTIFTNSYRLYVVGSTEYLNQFNVQGDHIMNWYDNKHSDGDFQTNMKDN